MVCAIFGGAAVTAAIQAGIKWLQQPDLPWWGFLAISGLCAAVSYLALRYNQKIADRNTPSETSDAQLWKHKSEEWQKKREEDRQAEDDLQQKYEAAMKASAAWENRCDVLSPV